MCRCRRSSMRQNFIVFFDEKIAGVRASTADAAPPSYAAVPPHRYFSAFRVLTNNDVISATRKLPEKQCAIGPLPTNLEGKCGRAGAIHHWTVQQVGVIRGVSFAFQGCIHHTAILKKPNLDLSDWKSYRLISNLSVLSKLLERLVVRLSPCVLIQKYLNISVSLRAVTTGRAVGVTTAAHCHRSVYSVIIPSTPEIPSVHKVVSSWRWLLLADLTRCDCVKCPCSFQLYVTLINSFLHLHLHLHCGLPQPRPRRFGLA